MFWTRSTYGFLIKLTREMPSSLLTARPGLNRLENTRSLPSSGQAFITPDHGKSPWA